MSGGARRRQRKLSAPLFVPQGHPQCRGRGGPEGGEWLIAERQGDVVTHYRANTEEEARRLAGLRPRKEED